MKKKYYFTLFVLLSIAIIFFTWKLLGKDEGDIILFSELKMREGEIESVANDLISLKTANLDFDTELMQQKRTEEIMSFISHKKIVVSEYTDEIKSEEDFRKEENDYLIWQKNADTEKDIFDFRFAPVWNRSMEISLSDFKKGDSVRLLYYNDGKKDVAVKLVKIKKGEAESESDLGVSGAEVNFSAVVMENLIERIKVKSLTAIGQNISEGEILDLLVDPDAVIKKATRRSEMDFRAEEKKVNEEKNKIKQSGGDFLSIAAPSWYVERNVQISELDQDGIVEIQAIIDNGKYFVKSIRQIMK